MEDVEQIVELAKELMLKSGYHGPTVVYKGTEGKGVVSLETFGKDAGERARYMANAGVLAALRQNVGELELIIFVSEAWMGRVTEKEEDIILPSLSSFA